MVLTTTKMKKLLKAYYKWLVNKPKAKDCPENLLMFLAQKNLLSEENTKLL